jgi:hypothetical protein
LAVTNLVKFTSVIMTLRIPIYGFKIHSNARLSMIHTYIIVRSVLFLSLCIDLSYICPKLALNLPYICPKLALNLPTKDVSKIFSAEMEIHKIISRSELSFRSSIRWAAMPPVAMAPRLWQTLTTFLR